jgi:hypothetical protein
VKSTRCVLSVAKHAHPTNDPAKSEGRSDKGRWTTGRVNEFHGGTGHESTTVAEQRRMKYAIGRIGLKHAGQPAMYFHDVHYYRDFKITAIRKRIDDAKNRLWSGLSLSSSLAIISSPSSFPQLPGSPLVFTPLSSVSPYLRAIHAELDIPSLRKFIRDNPLGILITALPSLNFRRFNAPTFHGY